MFLLKTKHKKMLFFYFCEFLFLSFIIYFFDFFTF